MLYNLLEDSLYWSGLAKGYSFLFNSSGAHILMYHSVTTDKEAPWIDFRWRMSQKSFAHQIQFLAKYRNVISLRTLVELIREKQPIPPNTVVITFDDGYLNNLDYAAPILKKFDLPATFFLTTGIIERQENMWIDQIYTAFKFRTCHEWCQEDGNRVDLNNPIVLKEVYLNLNKDFIQRDNAFRSMQIQHIKEQLKPSKNPPRLLMTWDEVKRLQQHSENFEIGGHTHDHLSLENLSEGEINFQITTNVKAIEKNLSRPVRLFSFPYSRYAPQAEQALVNNGIRGGVANNSGSFVTSESNPFSLPRIDPKLSMSQFKTKTYTACSSLAQKLRKG